MSIDQNVHFFTILILALYFGGWGYAFHKHGFKWYDIFTPSTAFFRIVQLVQIVGWWVVFFVIIPPFIVAIIGNWLFGGHGV